MNRKSLVPAIFLCLILSATIPRFAFYARAATVTITMSNFSFNPPVKIVSPGDTVTWVNNDQVIYTLWFTNSQDNSTVMFSDPISPGSSWSTSFSVPVSLKYYDFDRLWITGRLAVAYSPSLFRLDWSDFDNDNKVDIVDVAHVAICFDKTPASPAWATFTCAYWDFYLAGKITILDVAIVAFYFSQSSTANPFPGQGQPAFRMDPSWKMFCYTLPTPDINYCNSLP